MSEFNQELVKALAHGDAQAHDQIKTLPTSVRMALGIEVDKMRREEQIVPMSNGFSIYEKKKSSFFDEEAVGNALAERLKREKEQQEAQEKAQKEHLEKVIKYRVERARLGLK